MNLFSLDAKLTLDTSDYDMKIKEAIAQAKLDGATLADSLNAEMEGPAGTSSKKTGSAARETAKGILWERIIEKGANMIFSAGQDAVSAASDLKEIQNVVDTTFGTSAETINQWAQGQARQYGLSELQAKEYAANYGAFFKNHYSDQEAAQMAMDLAGLTGDFASYRNLPLSEAHTKILGGMSGEIDALKKYGFAPSVGAVEEYTGMDFDDLTEAEKAKARYDYMLGNTKYFQGDFLRTKDEFANSARTLENNLEALSAKFGEKLLPMMSGATNAANSFFDALYSESAEESLEAIGETAQNTAQNIGSSAEQARAMVGVLEDYGDRSALTAQQQEQWDYVAGSLARTIPELSGMLNMQTGEIEGGTSALYENIAAWEEAGKLAADTSALAAKEDYLSDISQNIAKEQAELAIAEKALSNAQTTMIAKAEEAAAATGEAFDGSAQSALSMLRRGADYYKMFGVKDIESTTSAFEEADTAVATHKENIAALQEDYTTVKQSIETDSLALSTAVGTMEQDVTASFANVGSSMDTLVSDMNQSDTAYSNAYNTGIGAANGLNDAYPAFEAAMRKYSFSPGITETSEMYGPMRAGAYDELGAAIATAVSGSQKVFTPDGRVLGDIVTEQVSRNIAASAYSRRYG